MEPVGNSLALPYVEVSVGEVGTKLEIENLSERFPAKVISEFPHDPDNERLRS